MPWLNKICFFMSIDFIYLVSIIIVRPPFVDTRWSIFGQPGQKREAEPRGRYYELKQKISLNLKSDRRQPL
jgi:hypothetical protein